VTGNDSGIATRFRGYLPVVIDVETGGFNSATDALLEIAAVTIRMDDKGLLYPGTSIAFNVQPFEGANIEQSALEFTGIDPFSALREAVPEREALRLTFQAIRREMKEMACTRAILVAHNAAFDQGFVNAAVTRCELKKSPFHPFSAFDTVTLCALAFGQTVLARACPLAGVEFEASKAHSALYDAQKTAELFCQIVNRWQALGGWPPLDDS